MQEMVIPAAKELIAALHGVEETIAETIGQHVASKEWGLVNDLTERGKQVQNLIQRAEGLKNDCLRFLGSSEVVESGVEDNVVPVGERTTWALIGDKIRSETTGGGSSYSNIVPTNLFFSLAMDAYKHIKMNGFVKTSHVLAASKEMIKEMSDYKSESSIRLPVYVTFKILVREGIFIKLDAHRYGLTPGKEEAFFDFLQKIDVAVSHGEAVRRLREAGEPEMADTLAEWENGKNAVHTKNGWDGAVSGPKGALFERFGSHMREVIWPYKY